MKTAVVIQIIDTQDPVSERSGDFERHAGGGTRRQYQLVVRQALLADPQTALKWVEAFHPCVRTHHGSQLIAHLQRRTHGEPFRRKPFGKAAGEEWLGVVGTAVGADQRSEERRVGKAAASSWWRR